MSKSDKSSYDKQKTSLSDVEKQKPLSFLQVSAGSKKNWLGSTVIKGAVINSATVCSYKEIRLKLLSFDKDGQRLEEHEDVINDVVLPNSRKDFRLRYHLPKSADSLSITIMSAAVAE